MNRNDPCPCGSGKKYKKCHGRLTVTAVPPAVATANTVKANDRRLVDSLMRFARLRFGPGWLGSAIAEYMASDKPIDEAELQLAAPWAIFDYPADDDGRSVARIYSEDQGWRVAPDLRAVLDANLSAWLGVWEVQRADEGVGLAVKDLLTGEERFIHEIMGSRGIPQRVSILGRVVDCGGISFFGGSHPRPLPPSDTEGVVGKVRRACRVRTRPIRTERLRDNYIQLEMIEAWREAIALIESRPMPILSNTDGDALAMVIDYFDIVAAEASDVVARLATLPGADPPEQAPNGETSIVVTKPDRSRPRSSRTTVIGRVAVAGRRIRVETNSRQRAAHLRTTLESHLGAMIRFRMRDESDAQALFEKAQRAPTRPTPAPQSAEIKAMLREVKERYMTEWMDEEIPALGGLTPKEAMRSGPGRRALDLLLREMEYAESRLPPDERFDVSRLRTILGVAKG
jgi:hypothetical protein